MNQRTNKQPQLLDNRQVLYHINVDKSISNLKDLLGLIYALIAGYISFRDKLYIDLLVNHGVARSEIAKILGTTHQNVSLTLHRSNSLVIEDRKDSQC